MERRCIIESLVRPTEKTSRPPAAGSHDGNAGSTPVSTLRSVGFTGSLFNALNVQMICARTGGRPCNLYSPVNSFPKVPAQVRASRTSRKAHDTCTYTPTHTPPRLTDTGHGEEKVVDGDAGGEKYREAAEKTMMHCSCIRSEKGKIIDCQEVVHHGLHADLLDDCGLAPPLVEISCCTNENNRNFCSQTISEQSPDLITHSLR